MVIYTTGRAGARLPSGGGSIMQKLSPHKNLPSCHREQGYCSLVSIKLNTGAKNIDGEQGRRSAVHRYCVGKQWQIHIFLFLLIFSHLPLLIIPGELLNRWPQLSNSPHTQLCCSLRGSASTSVNTNWKRDPPDNSPSAGTHSHEIQARTEPGFQIPE